MLFADTATVVRYTIVGFFLVLPIYIVAMNWGCVIVSEINRRKGINRHHSVVPLASIFLSVIPYLVSPNSSRNWVLLIPAIDIANWLVLWLPFWLIKEAWLKKKLSSITKESDQGERQK